MSKSERKTKIVPVRYRPSDLERLDAQARSVNLSRSQYIQYLTNISHAPFPGHESDFWVIYRELGELSKSLKDNILLLNTQPQSCQIENLTQILNDIEALRLNLCKYNSARTS